MLDIINVMLSAWLFSYQVLDFVLFFFALKKL